MISSTKNDRVKEVIELKKKAKARDEAGLFVVEGVRMMAELPPERVEQIYVSESFLAEAKLPQGIPYEIVTDSVFRTMSDTQTPQGVLALVKQYRYTVDDLLAESGRAEQSAQSHAGPAMLMILENLQDPGNLGTILRAGEGAGVTGVIMSRDTVDIYNPKVIRSTMGSVFRVPFYYTDDLGETVQALKARGVRIFAAHLAGTCDYEQADYTGDVGFLIGNEGKGLSDALTAKADTLVKIPMAGKVESLNAAIAASVLAFETARQRRVKRS